MKKLREEPATSKTDVSDLVFSGRSVLNVRECADKLSVTDQHIKNLIEEGELGAINAAGPGERKLYRVPAAEWAKFLSRRSSV